MRRPVVVAGIVLGLVAAFVAFDTARELRSFRRRPTQSVVHRYFSSALPHRVLGRAILLHPGANIFNGDVSLWVSWARPGDNFWNRRLIDRLLAALPNPQRRERLAEYPLQPTVRLVPMCLEALEAKDLPPRDQRWGEDEQRAGVLDLLQRIPGTSAHVEAWIEAEIVAAHDVELLERVLGSVVARDLVDWPGLLERFWAELPLWGAASSVGPGLREPTTHALAFLGFLEEEAARERTPPAELMTFLGPFLVMDATRARAERVLQQVVRAYPAEELSTEEVGQDWPLDAFFEPVPDAAVPELARTLFETARPIRPELAASAFHRLVHEDVAKAEQVAEGFFDEGDSMLRKAAVVLLIRHGSHAAVPWMDDAFAGAAPRRTYFSGALEYVYGSRATELYEEIAGHDYLGNGKAWPPARDPLPDAGERWAAFVERYPWHPGADDAAYQMLYAHFHAGDFRRVLAGAAAYFERERPDKDADPWVAHLARESVLAAPEDASDPPWVRQLRTLTATSLAELLAAPPHRLQPWLAALEWLREDEQRLQAAGIAPRTAEIMATVAASFRSSPRPRLAELEELQGIGQLDPSEVYQAFYGLHLHPQAHAEDVLASRQVAVARRGARAMAGLVERELGLASERGDERGVGATYRWILAHGSAEAEAFALAGELEVPFRHFVDVDPSGLPWPFDARVRAIHGLLQPGHVASP